MLRNVRLQELIVLSPLKPYQGAAQKNH